MTRRYFWQVDTFSKNRYYGNPAAVVFDAVGLSQEMMQRIAREMNLSETVFVLPPTEPEAHYWSRIFTPQSELPFAGHPTLATAYAMLTSKRIEPEGSVLRQQCGIGIVPVAFEPDGDGVRFAMTQGAPNYRDAEVDASVAATMLGCREADIGESGAEIVSTGLWWMIIPVRSLRALSTLEPDQRLIESICRERGAVGVTTFCPEAEAEEAGYRIRSFAPGEGVPEDPPCGSGNGSTAAYLAKHRYADEASFSYISEQGVEIGREGRIHIECERSGGNSLAVRVGGHAVQVLEGHLWT